MFASCVVLKADITPDAGTVAVCSSLFFRFVMLCGRKKSIKKKIDDFYNNYKANS